MSDDLKDDDIIERGHRCTIKRKRRGKMRSGEHGECECGAEYVWTSAPFAQWMPRFAGVSFGRGAHSKARRAAARRME